MEPSLRKSLKITATVLILMFSFACKIFNVNVSEAAEATNPATPLHLIATVTLTPEPLTPTSTAAPISLNPNGPHLLFGGSAGIWIANPDGSFLTQISEDELDLDVLRRAVSPAGDRMALVVRNDQGFDLVEVRIPGGEKKIIAHLFSITRNELTDNPLSPNAFTAYAIMYYDNVAWQPGDGRTLAFMGAINGPTSDLYLYDTQTQDITQLTDGPSQAVYPNWSPDGQYILHYGISWVPPFGGAIGPANQLNGSWAVRVSDGKVLTQPSQREIPFHFTGWQDDSHYITYDNDETCISNNLRSVDVASGEIRSIMDLSFYYQIVQSPENKALLFAGSAGCSTSPGEGTFLLFAGQTIPIKLLDKKVYEVLWLPESSVFQAYPEALFSADGNTRYDPPVYDASFEPAISKNGYQAWEVIENQQGRVVIKVPGGEWQTILNGSVDELIWDPISGQTLLIVLKDGTLYAASYPDFTARMMGTMSRGIDQAIWIP